MTFQKSRKNSSSSGTCKRNNTTNVKALEVPNSVEQVKLQNKDMSIKSALNESRVTTNAGPFHHSCQSNIILQVSSNSTQILCSIKSNELPPDSTGTTVDKNGYFIEENKSKSRKRPQSMDRSKSEKRTKSWDIGKTEK